MPPSIRKSTGRFGAACDAAPHAGALGAAA